MSKILFFFIILLSFNIQGKEFNNFSVDGINIKESLLNYTSRSNIKNEIANNWDWYEVSQHPNVTIQFIENNPDYNWVWSGVSKNPNVTMEFIKDHPEYPWDWKWVSYNTNITMEFIEAHPEYDWDWSEISCNPNLTMDFIEAHPEYPWNWDWVSKNKFNKNKELCMIEEARKYMAVYKIKKWWKKIYYSPNTEVGKRRLDKNYDDLFR